MGLCIAHAAYRGPGTGCSRAAGAGAAVRGADRRGSARLIEYVKRRKPFGSGRGLRVSPTGPYFVRFIRIYECIHTAPRAASGTTDRRLSIYLSRLSIARSVPPRFADSAPCAAAAPAWPARPVGTAPRLARLPLGSPSRPVVLVYRPYRDVSCQTLTLTERRERDRERDSPAEHDPTSSAARRHRATRRGPHDRTPIGYIRCTLRYNPTYPTQTAEPLHAVAVRGAGGARRGCIYSTYRIQRTATRLTGAPIST